MAFPHGQGTGKDRDWPIGSLFSSSPHLLIDLERRRRSSESPPDFRYFPVPLSRPESLGSTCDIENRRGNTTGKMSYRTICGSGLKSGSFETDYFAEQRCTSAVSRQNTGANYEGCTTLPALTSRNWRTRLTRYAPIMRNIRFLLPMTMLRYSQNPPIIAPIRFAPKKDDGFDACRKVVEKIRPAKKIGSGTTRRDHSNRSSKLSARTVSRLMK